MKLPLALLAAFAAGCTTGKQDQANPPAGDTVTTAASPAPRRIVPGLSEAMRSALDQFAATFEPFAPEEYNPELAAYSASRQNQLLYQAKGDFNGDGLADLALNGHDKTRELLIVILSQPDSSYKVVPLKEKARQPLYNHDVGIFLTAIGPGPLNMSNGPLPRPDSLSYDGVVVNYGEAASEVFYWTGTQFLQFFTGD